MDDLTPRQIAATVLGDDEENLLRGGTCLVAALLVGPINSRIVALTGIPVRDVSNYGYRLREAQIWQRGGIMNYPWMDDFIDSDGDAGRGAIGFVFQSMVAIGDMVRYPANDAYRLATMGDGTEGLSEAEILDAPVRRHWLKKRRLSTPHAGRKVLV
jgi:hypothetical protein